MTRKQTVLRPVAAAALLVTLAGPVMVSAQVAPGPKVAVINVVQLLEESQPGKKGIEDLKALQKAKADERDAMQAEAKELQEKISQGQFSLSEDKLAELQRQLEQKTIDLRRFNDDANRELQDKQTAMLQQIQNLVMPIIEAVGREGGYTMIFNKFESGLVYANETIDITSQVMERLNAAAAEPVAEPGS
ncbi:MAG: OmpH family outer membrane protein [Thermoanaerobaculia bacterium]